MRRLLLLVALGCLAAFTVGCHGGDAGSSSLDTSAPPPGPHANMNPPTKLNQNHQPAHIPPSPGGATGSTG